MGTPMLLGRLLFGGFFLYSGINHFLSTQQMAGYAAAHGVPQAPIMVMLAGALIIAGGVLIILGALPRLGAASLVAFAHGGWGDALEFSAAELLRQTGIGTLMIEGPRGRSESLAAQLVAAADWIETNAKLCHLSVGCFGVGTGADAVLRAA